MKPPADERIEILFSGEDDARLPGDALAGTVEWDLAEPPARVEMRLVWYTAGRGTEDVGVVATLPLEAGAARESRAFQFRLPAGPYSFSGRLISLVWAVEVVVWPGPRAGRREFVLSPTGEEIVLAPSPSQAL